MSNEDCIEYRDFLADPQPRGRWCGERSRERWSPLWRPFEQFPRDVPEVDRARLAREGEQVLSTKVHPAFAGLKPVEVIERGESDRLWEMVYYLRSGVPQGARIPP